MITLIQFPWSSFCITVRRMTERHRVPHRVVNIPNHDRTLVIKATGGRAYTVPCIVDARRAVADFTDFGQEVARYVDRKYRLGLFPRNREGMQTILARSIESQLEDIGFRVNDSYVIPQLPLIERTMVTRHKERKFGRGCIAAWRRDRAKLNRQFAALLKPMDNILASSPFLLGDRPLFVDYDLYGIIENYLYSGRTRLPAALRHLRRWHARMKRR
jgi:glutathione S-transferase